MPLTSNRTYWLSTTYDLSPYARSHEPRDGGILVIGSGLAGTSVAHHLLEKKIFDKISIVDCGTPNASYARNAGHILHGAGESYKATVDIHGEKKAKTIMEMSKAFIDELKYTSAIHGVPCDLQSGPYYRVAIDEAEESELRSSVELNKRWMPKWADEKELKDIGLVGAAGAYKCQQSLSGNPAMFRNALLARCFHKGVGYYACKVKSIEEINGKVRVSYEGNAAKDTWHDAVVICTNAYSQGIGGFFQKKKSIEPFKGQIIVSHPCKEEFKFKGPFSMDHGYIYGTFLPDNRLLIGGWRNNVPGGEIGCTDLTINKDTEKGLMEFAKEHVAYDLEWNFSWAGIMGSSNGGLPHVGPTDSDLIYSCAGFSGYGFGWAHGAAKLCADIMAGDDLIEGWELLRPR